MSSKEKEAVPPPAPETGQAKKKGGIRAAIMYELTPNMNFLPLKLTWFFFTSSTFAFIPYLTIHMKDIGISVEHIALMYAVLPFSVFIAPPLVGFLADKLGSYTKVVLLTITVCAVFHTLLLAVPTSLIIAEPPEHSEFHMKGSEATIHWQPCHFNLAQDSCKEFDNAPEATDVLGNNTLVPAFELDNCQMTCSTKEVNRCGSFMGFDSCSQNGSRLNLSVNNFTLLVNTKSICDHNMNFIMSKFQNDSFEIVQTHPECEVICNVVATSNKMVQCKRTDGNRIVTNVVYFIFRALATMGLGCNYVLLDAQTIQMIKVDEAQGKKGSLGRQYVFQAFAQAIISPVVGKLMDMISEEGKPPNYLFPFLIGDVFLALTFAMICCIKMELSLPKSEGLIGLKKIFTSLDICVFLFLMFILGNCFGFVETFLFVYLKDELGAPMYLLGLTITTGALVSIPFLYVADSIVDKMGQANVFIVALLTYAVRYVGYSYINDPWLSFPFEALELFTIQLMRIAMVQYIGQNAPDGLLATLNGLAGTLHYSVGRGTGGLIGGTIVAVTGSLAIAFRDFGVGAAVFGALFFVYEYFYVGGFRSLYKIRVETKDKDDKEASDQKLNSDLH